MISNKFFKGIFLLFIYLGVFIPSGFAFNKISNPLDSITTGKIFDLDVRRSGGFRSSGYKSSSYKPSSSRTTTTKPKSTTTTTTKPKSTTTTKPKSTRTYDRVSSGTFGFGSGFLLAYLIFNDPSHPEYDSTVENLNSLCRDKGYDGFNGLNNVTEEVECYDNPTSSSESQDEGSGFSLFSIVVFIALVVLAIMFIL